MSKWRILSFILVNELWWGACHYIDKLSYKLHVIRMSWRWLKANWPSIARKRDSQNVRLCDSLNTCVLLNAAQCLEWTWQTRTPSRLNCSAWTMQAVCAAVNWCSYFFMRLSGCRMKNAEYWAHLAGGAKLQATGFAWWDISRCCVIT